MAEYPMDAVNRAIAKAKKELTEYMEDVVQMKKDDNTEEEHIYPPQLLLKVVNTKEE